MKENKEAKTEKENGGEFPKNKLFIAVVVLCALTFIATAVICTFTVIDHFSTYSYISSLAEENGVELAKASKQGNLGNYNVASSENSIKEVGDGTYELTCKLQFTNFGKVGMSFNDAVRYTAYQNDKEVKSVTLLEDAQSDEADYKVRNGRSTTVVLTFIIPKSDSNVAIDMKSGNYKFTYTLKLTGNAQQQAAMAESTTAQVETEAASEAQTQQTNG